jgi:hypothetical protein
VFFAGDSKAGDTMGQGVNNVWYVVGVDGAPMGASGGAATLTAAVTLSAVGGAGTIAGTGGHRTNRTLRREHLHR